MERVNKVSPLQAISEEGSDQEISSLSDDATKETDDSCSTDTHVLSDQFTESTSSPQPKTEHLARSKAKIQRFAVRRRRSSFENVLKDSSTSDIHSHTSRRMSSYTILQSKNERNGMENNGFEAKKVDVTEAAESDRNDVETLALLRYFSEATASDDVNEPLDLEHVKSLIASGVPVNARDAYGQTVLHEAVRTWSLEAAQLLVKEGKKLPFLGANLGKKQQTCSL